MQTSQRIFLALFIGSTAGLICYLRLEQRSQMAADFTFSWRAAWYLLDGENPYQAVQPEGDYPFQTYFYYPLPAALVSLPFAFLPPYLAGALFFGLSSGFLAYAITKEGWKHLAIFLCAPYWVALSVAQWSPLIVAATLLPWLQWLLICKPNLGAAGFLYNPTRIGFILGMIFLAASIALLPTWPLDWFRITRTLEGHPPPLFILPFGPLLLLALLRWRTPNGRLLLGLSLLPQLLFFYDQLPLMLITPDLKFGLLYAAISWIAYLVWRLTGVESISGQILREPTQYVMMLLFLPALGLLFWPKQKSA
jgi:hypothetical protein